MGANRIRHPDYANLEHRGVSVNCLLYLLGGYVNAVANDNFFFATFEPEVSVSIAPSQITTLEPAVPQHLARRRAIVPVSGKDCRTPHGDLPDFANWHIFAVRIDDTHFDPVEGFAKRARTNGMRRIEGGWTGLRHPIDFAHWYSQQSLKAFLRAHRNAVAACEKSAKRADVSRLPRLLFDQELDHGRIGALVSGAAFPRRIVGSRTRASTQSIFGSARKSVGSNKAATVSDCNILIPQGINKWVLCSCQQGP
jgi:hypothetical protein